MLEKIMKKFALSEQGARDLVKACIVCAITNIALMLPVGILFKTVTDLIETESINSPFCVVCSIICIAFVFVVYAIQYNSTFLATYIETGVRRITLAEKLRKLPLSFFGKKDLADLTNTLMSDCTVLETAFSHFIPEFIGAVISTVIICASLFVFDWRMALAAVWVVPVSFIIVTLSVKTQDKLSEKQISAKNACADGIQECLECMCDIKSNNAEEKYLAGLTKKIRAVEKRAIISELGTAVFVITAQLVLKLGIATVSLAGSVLLLKGEINLITLFMFMLVASRLYDPLQETLINLAAIISTRKNVERMNEILYHDVQVGNEYLTNEGYNIKFENVAFSYNDGETILKDISFTAPQGQVTALVGPSGGGKTTISRLASRFWDVDRGKITVGGMDISQTDPETLLSLYSIVFQDVVLFDNTVLENIRIGRKDATDEDVMRAAEFAGCNEFIEKLAKGYDTMIGENGCELSGGERQRISIARAFLKDAPIILLDEATSSLDVENETLVQSALSKLIKNKTVLVIAHRMRTIANADNVVVLSDGIVKEYGTPDELINQKGVFFNMVNSQAKSADWNI